jgi:plastocyanin
MRRAIIIGVVSMAAACAGEGSTTTTIEPQAPVTTSPLLSTTIGGTVTTRPTATTGPTFDGPTADIVISGFSFGSQQTVTAGTTVIATNNDPFIHTWTSADGIWDSGSLSEGQSFAFTFQDPGTYSFFCKVHQSEMGGSIVIEG